MVTTNTITTRLIESPTRLVWEKKKEAVGSQVIALTSPIIEKQ